MSALKPIAVAGGSFLIADRVAKALPGTPAWALGWGAAATAGTFFASRAVLGKGVLPFAAAAGVALAYVHAFGHQSPYPHPPPETPAELPEKGGVAAYLGNLGNHESCSC